MRGEAPRLVTYSAISEYQKSMAPPERLAMTLPNSWVSPSSRMAMGTIRYGANTFGVTLIPMLFGVGLLFWNGRSVIGWLLTAAGGLFIIAGVLANMHIYFQPATLFHTLVMLILLVGGLGLIARALRPHGGRTTD